MRIALICNMNNMFFGLARYLRDRGWDAHLILLNNESPQFHPSWDCFDRSYQSYVRAVDWGDAPSFGKVSSSQVLRDVEPFEVLIGSGPSAAFLNRGGRVLDVFFPHGSDLYELPFLARRMRFDQRIRNRSAVELFENQAEGIRSARCINQEKSHPGYRSALKSLGVLEKTLYFGCPMVYTPIYNAGALEATRTRSAWYQEFAAIRAVSDVMVFNHARQVWRRREGDFHQKGSDLVMRAMREVKSRVPSARISLVQFEYGEDVAASKALVADLRIEDSVHWMPLMARKEIMHGLSLADFGCGQFSTGCIGGGTTWEVLAVGKPLLQWVRPEVGFDSFTSPYPYIQSRTEGDIADALVEFLRDPQGYVSLGEEGRRWYEENFVRKSLDTWSELIGEAAAGRSVETLVRRRVGEETV